MHVKSKIVMLYRPIVEKPLMLPRLSRPYLPLMLGGRPPEKLRVFICSGNCSCAVPGNANGLLKIMWCCAEGATVSWCDDRAKLLPAENPGGLMMPGGGPGAAFKAYFKII